jgi:putative sigma-54 modulation protein
MQFQLSGQQIEVTQSLRAHVASKLDRLTRLDDRLTSIAVVLSLDNYKHFAEATLRTAGNSLHAEASETDMYASIDIMFEKLLTQLRKHREKICNKHKQEVRDERQYA